MRMNDGQFFQIETKYNFEDEDHVDLDHETHEQRITLNKGGSADPLKGTILEGQAQVVFNPYLANDSAQ